MKFFALLMFLAAGVSARAGDSLLTGALRAVNARGSILIGVRRSSIPFSFLNKAGLDKAGRPVSFSIDIRHGIAAGVAAALNGNLLAPHALYNRWLTTQLPTGENLDLPISPHLIEMFARLASPISTGPISTGPISIGEREPRRMTRLGSGTERVVLCDDAGIAIALPRRA